eukprot:TRINITY_DN3970_c0_g2_i1.p1 TRINITY_DN3970_c0_g2~~TRINITY_DN3970_c0_g2_i1.p1  ORF type:complete len:541 (+),score=96.80 TRINITY_DN3970_c0_g2_i1:135-1757(+)
MGKKRSQRGKAPIEMLPNEILYHILCYIDHKSLFALSQVSHFWNNLCGDEKIWSKKCEDNFIFVPNRLVSNTTVSSKRLFWSYYPKLKYIERGCVEVKWFNDGATDYGTQADDPEIFCALYKSGKKIISLTQSNLYVWDYEKQCLIFTSPLPSGQHPSVKTRRPICWRNGKIATTYLGNSMVIYNVVNRRLVQRFPGLNERIRCIDWSIPDFIISSAIHSQIRCSDVRTSQTIHQWTDPMNNDLLNNITNNHDNELEPRPEPRTILAVNKESDPNSNYHTGDNNNNNSHVYNAGFGDGSVCRFDFRTPKCFVGELYNLKKFVPDEIFQNSYQSKITSMKLFPTFTLFSIDHRWLQKAEAGTGIWAGQLFHRLPQYSTSLPLEVEIIHGNNNRTNNQNENPYLVHSYRSDGRYAFIGTQDGFVQIWDVNRLQYLYSLQLSRRYAAILSLQIDDDVDLQSPPSSSSSSTSHYSHRSNTGDGAQSVNDSTTGGGSGNCFSLLVSSSQADDGFALCEFNGTKGTNTEFVPVSGRTSRRVRRLFT